MDKGKLSKYFILNIFQVNEQLFCNFFSILAPESSQATQEISSSVNFNAKGCRGGPGCGCKCRCTII